MAKKFILFGKNKNNSSLNRAMEQITQNLTSDLGLPALESVFNKYTGSGLTGAEREANDFSAEQSLINRDFQSNEAALQRDWSSAEAERARDWNEEMYYKYNSLQGKISQAEEAGVNPMLAVTGNAVSPMAASSSAPSGASANGSAPGSVSPSGHGLTDLLGSLMGLMKLKSEVDLNNATAEEKRASAENTNKQTDWIDKLSEAQLDNLVMSTSKLEEDLRVSSETANKLSAEFQKLIAETNRINQITDSEKRKLSAEAALLEWQNSNKEWMYGVNLGLDVVSQVNQIASTIVQAKTGIDFGNRPLVVPKDAQVFHPKDIVR